MPKKNLVFEQLYASERPYDGDDQHALIRKSRCEVLWSKSLGLVVVTEKGLFAAGPWLRIKTRAMPCVDRSDALKQGMTLVDVLERFHTAQKAGNHEVAFRLIQQAEAFGDPHRWCELLQGEQEAPPAQAPPAAPTSAPAGLPN